MYLGDLVQVLSESTSHEVSLSDYMQQIKEPAVKLLSAYGMQVRYQPEIWCKYYQNQLAMKYH